MVYAVVVAVVILGVIHVVNGIFSICLGVTSSIKAEIWLAHTVSPIWSGAFVSFDATFSNWNSFCTGSCVANGWKSCCLGQKCSHWPHLLLPVSGDRAARLCLCQEENRVHGNSWCLWFCSMSLSFDKEGGNISIYISPWGINFQRNARSKSSE